MWRWRQWHWHKHTPELYTIKAVLSMHKTTFRVIRPHTDGYVLYVSVCMCVCVTRSIRVRSTQFMLLAYEQSQAFYLAVDVNQLFLFGICCWWCLLLLLLLMALCLCVCVFFFHLHYAITIATAIGRIF